MERLKMDLERKITQTILKNPGQVNQETIAMEIKFKLKEKLLQ